VGRTGGDKLRPYLTGGFVGWYNGIHKDGDIMQDREFIWNRRKNEINFQKHGIWFKDVRSVFNDRNAILEVDLEHSYDEERFKIIGFNKDTKLICVCHCYRENGKIIRLISARKANKNETELYFGGIYEEIY